MILVSRSSVLGARYWMSRCPRPIFVLSVFPVEVGVYKNSELRYFSTWIPALAGMTFVTYTE